ncbi:formate dehydrogenase subunit gamma [Pseudochelatococcus sp. B33]
MDRGPDPERAAILSEILARHRESEGALLPILHDVQDRFGFVPAEVVPVLSEALSISRAEIHGVLTFYHDFRDAAAGQHVVKLCRAEACQAMGADRLADHARAHLGIDWHETTDDGRVTLEPVFCLGLCACGPAAMIDGRLVARMDETRLDALIEEVVR